MTYLMDNKTFLCQHKKLDQLTARRGKWIPETLYREIEKIVKNDSPTCGTQEGEETLVHQELTNCEIKYDQYHCYDCSQSLCLEIQSKKESLKNTYNLVKILITNNEDIDRSCGVSTDFINNLTDFFKIIGEKASTNIPRRKMNLFKKKAMLTCEYGLMYLHLDDYPPYSGEKSDIYDTHVNSNLTCMHGYTNCKRHADLITWVSNKAWILR